MLRLKKCCFNYDLFCGAMFLMGFSVAYAAMCLTFGLLSFIGEDLWRDKLIYLNSNPHDFRGELWIYRFIWFTLGFGYMITTIYLAIAIVKDKPGHAIPWLVFDVIGIILLFIVGMIIFAWKDNTSGILTLVGIVVRIYCWICVYSFYHELKEEQSKANLRRVQI